MVLNSERKKVDVRMLQVANGHRKKKGNERKKKREMERS